jgi:hypothetical protein
MAYHIETSSYSWDTPHEQQAIAIQEIYQRNDQLTLPWYFLPETY